MDKIIYQGFNLLADLLSTDEFPIVISKDRKQKLLAQRKKAAKEYVNNRLAALNGNGESLWLVLNCEMKVAYDELIQIIDNPYSISQKRFGFCGPAATLAIFFEYFPLTMVKFAEDILTKGIGRIGDLVIETPSEMLRTRISDIRSYVIMTHEEEMSRPENANLTDETFDEKFIPPRLQWCLMALLAFKMSLFEKDGKDGLEIIRLGTIGPLVDKFISDTNLVDMSHEALVFEIDNPTLITKKDFPFREFFVGLNAEFLTYSEYQPLSFIPNHWIWIINYTKLDDTFIELKYFTWGTFNKQIYDFDLFSASAPFVTILDLRVDQAE